MKKNYKTPIARLSAKTIMKKIKSLLSKLFSSLAIEKTQEPKSTDVLTSEEPDSNYVGDFGKKENQSKESKVVFESKKEPLEISTSMPFIISIKNDLDIPIENVSLFSHFNEYDISFNEKGNYVKDGLVISSDIPEISYKKIYEHLKNNSLDIGLTYIQSSTENQITQSFIFKYQNVKGLFFGKKINPIIDPYQQQNNIVAVRDKYTLDENSSIIYSKINPSTTLKIYFYPAKSINLNYPIFKGESKEAFINLKSTNEQIVDFILSKN